MKLKLHLNIKGTASGILLFESAPQFRTILIDGNKSSMRVAFPYLYHTIKYDITTTGKIVYRGQPKGCLSAHISNKPLESIWDTVWICPTEPTFTGPTNVYNGIVCTDHQYDASYYKSLKEMVKFVLNLYWGSKHRVSVRRWDQIPFNKVCSVDWTEKYHDPFEGGYAKTTKVYNYFDFLEKIYSFSHGVFDKNKFLTDYPEGVELINEDWK